MLHLPKNVYIISIVSGLCYSVTALMMLTGILVGHELTRDTSWCTVPIATLFLCIALTSRTITYLILKFGFKFTFIVSIIISIFGAGLAVFATSQNNFYIFVIASACFGFNAAAVRQSRFILVQDSIDYNQSISSLSCAAQCCLIGPLIGMYGKELFPSWNSYSGSFILVSAVLTIALFTILTGYNANTKVANNELYRQENHQINQKPNSHYALLRQPSFLLCVGSASFAYFIISLIACATPIKMIHIDGYSLSDTTLVIQTHLAAFFLPSVITASLIKSGLRLSLIVTGIIIYIVTCSIAVGINDVTHYWLVLLLLGFGWNFIYATTTTLLPESYVMHDRFRAQSLNDFIVHICQGLGALSAGWLLINLQWAGIILLAFALSVICLICIVSLHIKNIQANAAT